MRARSLALILAPTIMAAGCGLSTGGATNVASAAVSPELLIKNFNFVPNPLQAKVGTTVTVTNADGTNHTVTADDKSFDTGVFSTGTRTIHLTTAGTFKIHCEIHNFMTGVIQVEA